jgi:cell wall-associated NlpC family hydrolase
MRRRFLVGVAAVVLFVNAPHLGQPLARALDGLPGRLHALADPARLRPSPSTGRPAVGSPSAVARRAVEFALGQRGRPYRWGAEGPASFDCSGLAWAAYQAAGLAWVRMTAADQWRWLKARGRLVRRSRLAAGDLVFYAHDHGNPATIHHVGLYVGGGRMVEAPFTGALVRTNPISRVGYFGAGRPAPGAGR